MPRAPARPRITDDQRRARLAVRHHLAPAARVTDPVAAARGVVCLHATDPATVFLSAWARLASPSVAAVERALYDDRALLRMLAMRRTLWVTPVEDAPVLQAAAAHAVAQRERRRNEALVARLGVRSVTRWLRDTERVALAALAARGEATAQELARDVPALARKVPVAVGKKYEGEIGIASRVLLVLAAEGRLVRARPRGTWVSSQHRWTTVERWLGGPLASLVVDDARTELARRWLSRFGPGTLEDLAWWTGWPLGATRAALTRVGAVEVALDDGTIGHVLADDLAPVRAPPPWVTLLPSLDPTTMGWKSRAFYLGPHRATLFDTSGNAGPTLWCNGRIVGGWTVRSGAVVTKLLEDIGRTATAAIAASAARLTALLAGIAVTPRFPTPIVKQLASA
jgi:hypothetical protein